MVNMRPEWSYMLARPRPHRNHAAGPAPLTCLAKATRFFADAFRLKFYALWAFCVSFSKKLFLFETLFHKISLIKSFVLLTMRLSNRTLATWPVIRPF